MISSILLCIPSPLVAVFQVEHFTVKAFVLLMASVWVSPLILANCTLVGSLNPAVSWNASWNVPIEQSALTKLLTNCMCCEAFQKARYFSTLSSKKQPLLLHFLTKCFVFPSITFPFPLNTFCVLSQYFFFFFLSYYGSKTLISLASPPFLCCICCRHTASTWRVDQCHIKPYGLRMGSHLSSYASQGSSLNTFGNIM